MKNNTTQNPYFGKNADEIAAMQAKMRKEQKMQALKGEIMEFYAGIETAITADIDASSHEYALEFSEDMHDWLLENNFTYQVKYDENGFGYTTVIWPRISKLN